MTFFFWWHCVFPVVLSLTTGKLHCLGNLHCCSLATVINCSSGYERQRYFAYTQWPSMKIGRASGNEETIKMLCGMLWPVDQDCSFDRQLVFWHCWCTAEVNALPIHSPPHPFPLVYSRCFCPPPVSMLEETPMKECRTNLPQNKLKDRKTLFGYKGRFSGKIEKRLFGCEGRFSVKIVWV